MEQKKYEDMDFEFTLMLNDNIIVKRCFDARKLNEKAMYSLEFKEAIDGAVKIIDGDLRKKSISYMLENIDNFYEDPRFDTNNNDDVLTIRLKYKGKCIAERKWSATVYPARIRYTVNILSHIYDIINPIQKTLSSRYITTDYLGYNLTFKSEW